MSQYFEVIGVSSPCKELAELEKDEEVEVMAIDMSRHANKDVISLWNTYKFLKREKQEIVHTHNYKCNFKSNQQQNKKMLTELQTFS